MSVIFGLFYKDGRPVRDELETMFSGMAHFPHERCAFIKHNNSGFGHMLTYNTPEAIFEAMPQHIESAGLLFTAEGRLDNRGELFAALNIPLPEQEHTADGALMHRAYLQWGEACVNRLAGKWSFAAFHFNGQRLFLARDKWDISEITYYADERVFAFSTSEKGLFPLPYIHKEIDDLMLARHLAHWPGDCDSLLFKNIRRLLPGHTLSVTREHAAPRQYWSYKDISIRRGLTLEAYTEDLLDRLNQAVAARLRSFRPVAATLSGGLDSSTVCVLAAEQLARQGKRLRTYTHVLQYTPPRMLSGHRYGDERPFAQAVADTSGNMDPVFLSSAGISPLEGIRESLRLYGIPIAGASNAYWLADLYTTAAKEKFGTMLLGIFGNGTISWKGLESALPAGDLLRRSGLKSLIRAKLMEPVLHGNTALAQLYKRKVYTAEQQDRRSYCAKALEDSCHLTRQNRIPGFDPTLHYYFKDPKDHAKLILDLNILRLSNSTAISCETGMEIRDPTCDPLVIESTLAIPNEMYFGDMHKWILRTMMKGRLPDQVRLNQGKGIQNADIVQRLCVHKDEMDAEFAEMNASDFHRIADMERLTADWEALKAYSSDFPTRTASKILLFVAVYELLKTM